MPSSNAFIITTLILILIICTEFMECKLQSIDDDVIHNKRYARLVSKEETTSDGTEDTLQMLLILHRHGDRTPIYYPTGELSNVRWPNGMGQLTPTGINQLYNLGVEVRNKIPFSILPASYTADIVRVRASDTDRTLQSAFALMTGFYPPGTGPKYPFEDTYSDRNNSLPFQIQPIPIHTVDPSTDYLLRSFDNCKAYQQYLIKDVFTSNEAIQKQQENQELLDLLSSTFAMNVTLFNLNMPYDVLYCEHAHGYYDLHGINNDTFNQVNDLMNWVFANLEFKPSDQSYLIGAPLIGEFISRIDQFISGDNHHTRLYHYSGHDVSVGSLLSGLGYQIDEVPVYGAHVFVELHEIDDQYYVNLTYNSQPISIPNCESSFGSLCPYSTFRALFKPLVPSDAAAACSVTNNSPPSNNNNNDNSGDEDQSGLDFQGFRMYIIIFVLLMIGIALLALIISLFAYYYFNRQKGVMNSSIPVILENEDDDSAISYEMDDISGDKM